MNANAHGLITISNKTTLRDFSQGIFRMRNILDSQSFDIILNNLLTKNSEILMGGNCFIDFNEYQRELLFEKVFKKNQTNFDIGKKKVLLKQNIIGIIKHLFMNILLVLKLNQMVLRIM